MSSEDLNKSINTIREEMVSGFHRNEILHKSHQTELANLKSDVQELKKTVSDRNDGLVIEVDRLKQSEKKKEKWLKWALGLAGSAVMGFLGLVAMAIKYSVSEILGIK